MDKPLNAIILNAQAAYATIVAVLDDAQLAPAYVVLARELATTRDQTRLWEIQGQVRAIGNEADRRGITL